MKLKEVHQSDRSDMNSDWAAPKTTRDQGDGREAYGLH